MKIGIIGLGSIGKRHVSHLINLGFEDIVALRTKKGEVKNLPPELLSVQEVYDEDEFYAHDIDGLIISNPTSLHVKYALPTLKKGAKVFIEKPVAHDLHTAQALIPYANQLIIGYCMRFSEHVSRIRRFLSQGKLGKLYKASFYRSFYLPKWHPYADYRNEYTARKDLGGGVIRTLSHEIDLMHYLFGQPINVTGVVDKISDLEIDTDDFCFFTCKMKNGARINFELDFLSPDYVNRIEIIGEFGKLVFDENTIDFSSYNGEKDLVAKYDQNLFDRMYEDQMKDFINFIEISESKNCRLQDSISALEIIEKVEKNESRILNHR